jgi:hypothetical protein
MRMGFFMVQLGVFRYYFFTFTRSLQKTQTGKINSKIKHE